MKKYLGLLLFVFTLSIIVLLLIPALAFADSCYDYNSTNEWNKNAMAPNQIGTVGPHVNLISVGEFSVTLEFVMPEDYWAGFEYRSDGDTSQAISPTHDNPWLDPCDSKYPFVWIRNESLVKTIGGSEYVEVRLAFGGERDWDFDWTRFDVGPWVRTHDMTCYQVWINEDNNFEFVFWWVYGNNNWVQIFDMEGNLVWETDFPKNKPHFEVDLPDGMYKVQTFHEAGKILQEFYIGKPGPDM